MQLTVQDAAQLLRVSEDTIYQWIREEDLPAVRFNDRYHFNRTRLIEWAHERRLPVAAENGRGLPSLESALIAGGILPGVPGAAKPEVLRYAVDHLRLPEDADRELLYQMILTREQQGSTGFGHGIAIPHARRPILIQGQPPSVTVCYLENPVEFGAVDGKPVFVLFLLVTPTVPVHLHLLSRLGAALKNAAFSARIQRRAGEKELLPCLRALEEQLGASGREPSA